MDLRNRLVRSFRIVTVGPPKGQSRNVILRHLAAALFREGLEKEEMEAWIKGRIEDGASIIGVHPPDAKTTAEYRASRAVGTT